MKLVDTLALGASAARHEGSSPFLGTHAKNRSSRTSVFCMGAQEESQPFGFCENLNEVAVSAMTNRVRIEIVTKSFPNTEKKNKLLYI